VVGFNSCRSAILALCKISDLVIPFSSWGFLLFRLSHSGFVAGLEPRVPMYACEKPKIIQTWISSNVCIPPVAHGRFLHAALCCGQCARWWSRPQYATVLHAAHWLRFSFDPHIAHTSACEPQLSHQRLNKPKGNLTKPRTAEAGTAAALAAGAAAAGAAAGAAPAPAPVADAGLATMVMPAKQRRRSAPISGFVRAMSCLAAAASARAAACSSRQ
jgi:hypothetical protein